LNTVILLSRKINNSIFYRAGVETGSFDFLTDTDFDKIITAYDFDDWQTERAMEDVAKRANPDTQS
jgi:hypothetical protein